MSHNWALNCKKRQKVSAEKLEFLENFWSFAEFLEWFGVFLERSGVRENFEFWENFWSFGEFVEWFGVFVEWFGGVLGVFGEIWSRRKF